MFNMAALLLNTNNKQCCIVDLAGSPIGFPLSKKTSSIDSNLPHTGKKTPPVDTTLC